MFGLRALQPLFNVARTRKNEKVGELLILRLNSQDLVYLVVARSFFTYKSNKRYYD